MPFLRHDLPVTLQKDDIMPRIGSRVRVHTVLQNRRSGFFRCSFDRVTDHRIGLTIYRLEDILNGNLDEVFDALATADQAAKLASQEA